ncbi:MAG: hypothetical protein NUV67_03310 [archaeon]|nr:hypothetical protein [archaeon]
MAEDAENAPKRGINEIEAIMLLVIAVLLRVLLERLPSVEPIIPIAVYAGLTYGASAGTIIGLLGYPISNFFMQGGVGLWSFWQAIGGGIAGNLSGGKEPTMGNMLTYTFIGTIIFELAMNITSGAFLYWPYSYVHIATNLLFAAIIGAFLPKEK